MIRGQKTTHGPLQVPEALRGWPWRLAVRWRQRQGATARRVFLGVRLSRGLRFGPVVQQNLSHFQVVVAGSVRPVGAPRPYPPGDTGTPTGHLIAGLDTPAQPKGCLR